MTAPLGTTLLVSLDAVVLDTETTGLDARTARLVQVGAIRMFGGEELRGDRFEQLVNPGVPIPQTAIAIHGITDAMVQNAPVFDAVAPALAEFCASAVIVGHAIAYDIAILKREHDRVGRPWRAPRTLDVRDLARVAAPELAHYDLDRLCSWLGITVSGRHTAMGDAQATARVFAALLQLLRQRNVRTLAEAETAVRLLLERQIAGGAPPPDVSPGDGHAVAARLDSFPYRHRVREIMSAPPVIVSPAMSVHDAARLLIERKISSVFATTAAGEAGIATERDILRAIAAHGSSGLQLTVGDIMSAPLQSVEADAFLYRAIGRMDRLGFRHLAVRDRAGEIVGALTIRNLLRQRSSAAIVLGDAIERATQVSELGLAFSQLPLVAQGLLDDDTDPRLVAAVISAEIVGLTRRAAELAEHRMLEEGRGPPPVPYCVLVLGSAGRGESLLAADQDNAFIFESGEPGGPEDRWFEAAARHMTTILDAVGVRLCKGGVMASNALWRHSVQGWKDVVDGWIRRQRPEDLLNVDIFFDAVPAHGAMSLGDAIWRHAYDRAEATPDFVKMLSLGARQWMPPLTWFGGIKADGDGRIDLKRSGLMPILIAARALSIRHGVHKRATPDRLRGFAAKGVASIDEVEDVIESHRDILRAILLQQLTDAQRGIPLSARVAVKSKAFGRAGLRRLMDGATSASRLANEGTI